MKREMPWEKLLLPDAIRNIMSNTKLTMPAGEKKNRKKKQKNAKIQYLFFFFSSQRHSESVDRSD